MSSTRAQLNEEHLIGTWRLSAREGRADDGAVMLPYTDKPECMLVYNTDGTMIIILMKPDQPLFESTDLLKGFDEEIRAAVGGFNAYCGRFVLDPEAATVTHHLMTFDNQNR